MFVYFAALDNPTTFAMVAAQSMTAKASTPTSREPCALFSSRCLRNALSRRVKLKLAACTGYRPVGMTAEAR